MPHPSRQQRCPGGDSGSGARGESAASVSCRLLGVHSSRFDMATRDPVEDEALGLNCAWYADILLTLSEG